MSDKLQRYVCQYFAETITANISKVSDSSDEEEDGAASNAKGTGTLPPAFVTAHLLIKQLNRSVPSLLLNVIPQLEEELGAEKPEYRKLATETLGAMFGEKIGHGDLARKYPTTWKTWLNRSKDKVVAVRIAMVDSLKKIWTEHAELGADIEGSSLSSFFLSLSIHPISYSLALFDSSTRTNDAVCFFFGAIETDASSLLQL